LLNSSHNEYVQLVEQLKAGLFEAWLKEGDEAVASINFGFDLHARTAFWHRMQQPIHCWCARQAKRVLQGTVVASPVQSQRLFKDAAIYPVHNNLLVALVDAALVEIFNGGSLGQAYRARDLLWARYEARILKKANGFDHAAARKGMDPLDLCQKAFSHLFCDKAQDSEDPEARHKGEAKIRRYRPLFAGDSKAEKCPRQFATLATFVDKVLRNYFIQETRQNQHTGPSQAGKLKVSPQQPTPAAMVTHAGLVEQVLDRVMQHPKMGVHEDSRELRPVLQNQSQQRLHRAVEDDSALLELMKGLPKKSRRTVAILNQDAGEDAGNWEKYEHETSVRQNENRLREQRNAEYREILDHILACLREEKTPTRRHAKSPLDKVEVFRKFWLDEMTLKDIVAQVNRSIGSVQGAVKELFKNNLAVSFSWT